MVNHYCVNGRKNQIGEMPMITGNIIEEIRQLPPKNIYRHILSRIEDERRNDNISTDNVLEICTHLTADYQLNKTAIIADLNEKQKITVIDAIMGAGKSTYIINEIINKNPQYRYICVLPTLKECERYTKFTKADTYEPQRYGTKSIDLRRLIANGKNIVTTHALIQNIDADTMALLEKSNYILIIDECLDVVHQYERNFKSSDLKSIFNDNYVITDEQGYLIWNNEKEQHYDGRWNDIKQLCNLHSLASVYKGIHNKTIKYGLPTY